MRVLILGGTSWLGGRLATTALARGHQVTCLARGESGDPPSGVRWVAADRSVDSAYDDVRDEAWDEVVDVSWQPGFVRSALLALGDAARHWTYVSSCSVYAADDTPGADESAPVHEPQRADTATFAEYGPAKSACESAVADALGDRALVSRAGLIGGVGDRSDRFGYWPARFAWAADHPDEAGGAVLVPSAGDQQMQTIDVGDMADWLVRCAENGTVGTFNTVGERVTLDEVFDAARAAAGHTGPVVRAPVDWLTEQGVEFWMGEQSMPLLLPTTDHEGFASRSDAASLAAGLTRRPLATLVADTLADERARGLDRPRRAGLTRAKERELLAALA